MKLWIDDVRPAPEGYKWLRSVEETKVYIGVAEEVLHKTIELVDIDHDSGDYYVDGGDYIELLKWFEETGRNYPIRIHSMNVVGRMNMEAICRRNGWELVK